MAASEVHHSLTEKGRIEGNWRERVECVFSSLFAASSSVLAHRPGRECGVPMAKEDDSRPKSKEPNKSAFSTWS